MGRYFDDELLHYGVKGMKWGVRRYQNTDGSWTNLGKQRRSEKKRNAKSAKQIHSDASKREKKIGSDLRSALKSTNAKLYGLDHRLKTEKSIARKLKTGKDIKDAVRYTTISSEKDFVKNYNKLKSELEKKGYSETRCKNYFEDYRLGKVNHKSVQSNFKTDDGYEFEIQFHTKSSQNAKDRKVPLYEEARSTNVSAKRKDEIISQMQLLAESVEDPKDIRRIKSH